MHSHHHAPFTGCRWGLLTAMLAAVVLAAAGAGAAERRTIGRVERSDPRLDALIAPGALIEVLADGFRWSEGPVWDRAKGRLLFSDVPNNTVHAWTETDEASVFLKPSGYTGPDRGGGREPGANGLAFDAQGRLVLCQHGNRRWRGSSRTAASRRSPTGTRASASTARTTS